MEELGHVLRRNSIVRHKAVRVSQNILVAPWAGAFSSMTTLTSWHARPSILKGTSSKLLCLVIDEGKTVTGILFGVHWNVNKSL